MLIILGTFSLVFLMIMLGFIGELLGGLFSSNEEEMTQTQSYEEDKIQLASC
jgi:hypothetical protein